MADLGVPESEVLSSFLEVFKTQFAELRVQLVQEVCHAVRATAVGGSKGSRRNSGERSLDPSEFSAGERGEREGLLLRPHKPFASHKILAELEEEEEIKPVRRDDRVHPVQVQVPQPMEKLKSMRSETSSTSSEPVAPPIEPAPTLAETGHELGSSTTQYGSNDVYSPAISARTSRKGHGTMTEKAFGLTRAGSMTSVDLDRYFWLRQRLLRMVQNVWFETISMIVLCANAVVIGVQTDYMATNNLASVPWTLRCFDIGFCLFFTLELLLRISAHGKRFFTMNGCAWNIMDLLLVSAHVTEEVLLMVADVEMQASAGTAGRLSSNTNPDIMRVIRILRAIKVVRLVGAVRFTQDLQLLINCLFRSLKQFLWSALLLLLAIYVVAIYICQAATTYRLEQNDDGAQIPCSVDVASQKALMLKWWGSMPQSVLSLFQGVTGGVDWHAIADPLIDGISPWFGLLFIVFMAFCILALLNVITGTFVETMSQQAKELQLRNRIYQARRLFREIDIDGSGFISPDEILGQTSTPAVQEFFETIDVDPSDAKGLLEVIDIDGNGKINFEEFLEGSLRLNGSAKSSDLIMLAREMKRFQTTQLRELAEIKAALV